ncbi:MAG: CPBP family intramembrane metalloprotease [Bacillota bacterium]|nr:CPBP family intramembrane metalloprotease [Bacillota bacterium]
MNMETETIAIIFLAFTAVIIFGIVTIVNMMVKSKSKSYIWFLVQIVLQITAFFMFIGFSIVNSNIPREKSIAIGTIGLLLACSVLCMIIGVSQLSRNKAQKPDREKEEYAPGFLKGFGMLVFYFLVCTLIPDIIFAMASKSIGLSPEDPLFLAFTTIIALGLLILWIKRKYIINFKSMISIKKISIIFFVPMTLTILGLGILLSDAGNFTTRVIPMNDFWLKVFSSFTGNGFADWKGILAFAVVAPISEEIIFRGMVLKGFLKHYSVRKSIILSALLFGIAHMNPWQFVSAFAAGIVLGWWYVKTDSIITTIFGHALNNGMICIIGAIGLKIPGYNAALAGANHQPVWFDLLGVILLAVGIVWLSKLFNEKKTSLESNIVSAEQNNL